MTLLRRVTAVLLLVPLAAPCASARPAAAPARRQAEERSEERAERELAERMESLEEEYRAKKAEVLRRFVSQLTAAKNDAMRGRDPAEAQRIFERISDASVKIAELAPATVPAVRQEAAFSLTIYDFDGAAGYANVVNVTGTDVSVTAENDYGRPSKVVYEAKLTGEQQAASREVPAVLSTRAAPRLLRR